MRQISIHHSFQHCSNSSIQYPKEQGKNDARFYIVYKFSHKLEGNEGILVASKIADRVGITRSVIVNALRKFESAGVIESRSSGMKGTYIKVLNDVVFEELKKL